jgi:hypothetical protein
MQLAIFSSGLPTNRTLNYSTSTWCLVTSPTTVSLSTGKSKPSLEKCLASSVASIQGRDFWKYLTTCSTSALRILRSAKRRRSGMDNSTRALEILRIWSPLSRLIRPPWTIVIQARSRMPILTELRRGRTILSLRRTLRLRLRHQLSRESLLAAAESWCSPTAMTMSRLPVLGKPFPQSPDQPHQLRSFNCQMKKI